MRRPGVGANIARTAASITTATAPTKSGATCRGSGRVITAASAAIRSGDARLVPDAQFLLAAVEDQRHDQILLVVKMAHETLEQRPARGRVILATGAQRIWHT